MRSLPDRIRHTVSFEAIALVLVATLGSWITGYAPAEIGGLGIAFSLLAMVWNLSFNWMFDHWEARRRPGLARTMRIRIIHALLFELVLMTVGVFLTAWWLNIGLMKALILDIGFSAFFLIYAFLFNWAYDMAFPIRRTATANAG